MMSLATRMKAYCIDPITRAALNVDTKMERCPWTFDEYYHVSTSATEDIEMELGRRRLEEPPNWCKLCFVIKCNQESLVLRMLREKPRLMQPFKGAQYTAVREAAKFGEMGMIRMLVQFITDNHNSGNRLASKMLKRGDAGDTPLHIALKNRKIPAALFLIEIAPQAAYIVNNMGYSPLCLAVHLKDPELLSFMINQVQVSDPYKDTLLSHAIKASLPNVAIKFNHLGTLQILMEKLPSLIDSSDAKGWKPLSYAANKGNLDQVSFLLSKFPKSVDQFDRDGSLPIHKAVAGGHIDVVKEFISQCPHTLYGIDRKGRSVLHIATRYHKADILSYLLQAC